MEFSNLGISQKTILNGLEDYFEVSDEALYDQEENKIASIGIIGSKDNPKSTSFSFHISKSGKLADFLKELLLTWLDNIMHSSTEEIYNWILNMMEVNVHKESYEYFRYFDTLIISLEKKITNQMVISIERIAIGEIDTDKPSHVKYEKPSGPPPSYLKEFNEWLVNDGESRYMPSYYQYPFSDFTTYEEEMEYKQLLEAFTAGYLSTDLLPGSYQFAPMWLSWEEGNRENYILGFDFSGDDRSYIKTQNVPNKHKICVESFPSFGGVVSFDKSNWATSLTHSIAEGEGILIFADSEEDYTFDGWYKGDYKFSEANPHILDINSYSNIKAKFLKSGYLIVHNERGNQESLIKIQITGKNIPSVSSFQLHISYDNDFVEPNYNLGSAVNYLGPLKEYQVFKVSSESQEEITVSGGMLTNQQHPIENDVIMTVNMRVKNKKGKTTIKILETSKILGSDYQEIQLILKDGILEIN